MDERRLEHLVALDISRATNRFRRKEVRGEVFFAATSGWSLDVDTSVALQEVPTEHLPSYAYHGTLKENRASISKDGLLSGSRRHVHLSRTPEQTRMTSTIIVLVDIVHALRLGVEFMYAPEGKREWLYVAGSIPAPCLSFLSYRESLEHFQKQPKVGMPHAPASRATSSGRRPDPAAETGSPPAAGRGRSPPAASRGRSPPKEAPKERKESKKKAPESKQQERKEEVAAAAAEHAASGRFAERQAARRRLASAAPRGVCWHRGARFEDSFGL